MNRKFIYPQNYADIFYIHALSVSILHVEERGLECQSADFEAAQTALDHTSTLARRVPRMICVRHWLN